MNFNIGFILLLLVIAACGVKGDPVAPKSPATPSLMENYPDIQTDKPLLESRKPR